MKRFSTLFLSFILILGMLAGCSGNSSQSGATAETKDGKVVIDFWSFWGSETRRPIIEKIISDYNESQDKVQVKHTFLPWGDIWTKNLASIAAGSPADVVINDINTVAHRAKNNQSTDLSPYLDDAYADSLYPHLWETVLYEDKPYAAPFVTDTRLLFYNKDAFREAGLDPNKPPKTWDELEEYAQKLDIKQGSSYERIGFYPLFGSLGAGSWMNFGDEGNGYISENEDIQIATENKIQTMNWLLDWQERYGQQNIQTFRAEFGSEQANPFISGKVAMWADVGTFYTQIRDYGQDMDFGVAPIPAKTENDQHFSEGGGFVAEVPKGASHPEEAADFIKYLTGPEAQKYWAAQNFDNVANIEAAEQTINDLQGKDEEVYKAAVDNLEHTLMFPTPVKYPDYLDRINPVIDEIMLGRVSPEDGLNRAQSQVEKMK
ncbi:extracellular solute-binding protein [Bacillus lacus]|uniref:Extracellular solute-binding protein n=1 Tax=Metabacillus lacus TaxID=1983721 RepID=A0A7X2LWS1_9BACI|nr:ABC transporter substrate-binding protein [Metabacillus lacus]MRX71780.1 extracellular solute-binding protein [Metabacillus lacus]